MCDTNNWYGVLIGAGVAIVVYALERGLFDLILDFRRARGEVIRVLHFHSQKIRTSGQRENVLAEAASEMRKAAAELFSKWSVVPIPWLWSTLRLIPTYEVMKKAAGALDGLGLRIRMGNHPPEGTPSAVELANEVCDLLKLDRQF